MRAPVIASLLLLAYAFPGAAQVPDRRWIVQTSDGKLIGFTDDQDVEPPDAAFATFVLESVIRMADPPGATGEILPLGTWDGTDYTAPSGGGIVEHIDPTTDQGSVQEAARTMLDVFDAALELMDENRQVWPYVNIEKATEGIHWMIVNMARVALNATRTAANRVKALGEAASWPTGLSGDPRQYVDAMDDQIADPSKDWCWVTVESDPPGREDITGALNGFNNATNVEDAPVTDKLIGRAWINDIP